MLHLKFSNNECMIECQHIYSLFGQVKMYLQISIGRICSARKSIIFTRIAWSKNHWIQKIFLPSILSFSCCDQSDSVMDWLKDFWGFCLTRYKRHSHPFIILTFWTMTLVHSLDLVLLAFRPLYPSAIFLRKF